MSEDENKTSPRFSETKIIVSMISLTVIMILCMVLYGTYQNKKLSVNSSEDKPGINSQSTDYKGKKELLEKEYDDLILDVRKKLTDAKTVHQQNAVTSYYTMEVMGLLLKQNNLIIEQNDKIIELLTEIKKK